MFKNDCIVILYHNNTIFSQQFKKAKHFLKHKHGFAICCLTRLKL